MELSQTARTVAVLGHWAVQLLLALLGVLALFDPSLRLTFAWCLAGSLYAAGGVVVLSIAARRGTRADQETERVWLGRVRGPVAWVFTIVPALIGALAAYLVITSQHASPDLQAVTKLLGVWAMLLGWALMHWGFAQIYLLRSEAAAPGRVLEFPRTGDPGLVDHVYFAFTVGTTFAASDVSVLTTRLRWLVTIHSVISFGLNALTIALAFNTIMGLGT